MVRLGGVAALVWLAATGMAAASEATLMINRIAPVELRLERLATDPVTDPAKRFGAWTSGTGTHWGTDEPGLRTRLQQVSVGAGLDYRVTDGLVLGIAVIHEDTHADLLDAFGRFDRVGWSVSPYLAWQPFRYVTLSAMAGWADQDNTAVTGAGGSATYDSNHRHARAGIAIHYPIGAWRLGAMARYLWVSETDAAYVTTGGAAIRKDKRIVEQGRVMASLGYDFGGFRPFVTGGIEREFNDRRTVFVGPRQVASDHEGFLVGAGVDFALSPFQGTLRYVTEKGRDGNDVFGGNAKRLEVSFELPF